MSTKDMCSRICFYHFSLYTRDIFENFIRDMVLVMERKNTFSPLSLGPREQLCHRGPAPFLSFRFSLSIIIWI